MHEFPNKQLVMLIQAHSDENAINELFNRYHGKIRQLVMHKVPVTSDVDDLVQEIFVKIFTNITHLQYPNKLDSWINQIVYTQVNDYYRMVYRKKEFSLEQENKTLLDTILISDSSEDITMRKFNLSDIYEIILGLPSDKTNAFLLRHLHGMSYDEIASATEEKHSTIRGKIARTKTNIIDGIFDETTPKETRTSISSKLSQLVAHGDHLEHHFKKNYFQNQELLAAINPKRVSIKKPKVYFSQSLDNIMILVHINKDILACFIRVKCKTAIPILLNRISTKKTVYCVFLSTEYIEYAKKYLEFVTTETINYSFIASPTSNVEPQSVQSVTQSTFNNKAMLNYLQEHDVRFKSLVSTFIKEYGKDSRKYKFFTTNDPVTGEIYAYAFFLQTDTHLWELVRYISFNKSKETHLKQCIAVGTKKLLNQNYFVSNTGITEADSIFIEIAPALGFVVAYQSVSGNIRIK